MKSKKKQTVLIILVVFVWGVIGYQIYQVLEGSTAVNVSPAKVATSIDTLSATPYQLIANYRDPFLKNKNTSDKKSGGTPKLKSSKLNVSERSTPVNWKVFKFLGTVENENTRERVALISSQGKMMMLKKNDSVEGFSIIKVFKDSVEIGFNTQKKIISKNSH